MVRTKFVKLREELKPLIFERTDEVTGLLLALLTRKHIMLVGPGGTAKSLTIRLVTNAIDGASYWDYQFNKYSTPEDVFGPPSIKALQEGTFRRITTNRLPEAHFALADEVFEANASILNALRKIMNERLFENDGGNQKVPLEVLMAGTNLIPTEETLAALYDRFLLRYKLGYIAETANFLAMLKGPKGFEAFAARMTVRMTLDEIHEAQDDVRQVSIPEAILEAIATIRATLGQQGVIASDRRWNESTEVIKAKAWLQGRAEAKMDDLGVLVDILWADPQHKGLVQSIVLEVANPLLKRAEEQHDAVQVAWSNLMKTQEEKEKVNKAVETLAKVNGALKELEKVKRDGEKDGMDMARVDEYIRVDREIQLRIQRDFLDIQG